MILSDVFLASAEPQLSVNPRAKTSSPFSLRLSPDERERLTQEAGGLPLGQYMRAKLLGGDTPLPRRRAGQSIEDRKALGQALALLGQTHYSSNLNQLAHLANLGVLPLTPEVVEELAATIGLIAEIRRLLLIALGLKDEVEK